MNSFLLKIIKEGSQQSHPCFWVCAGLLLFNCTVCGKYISSSFSWLASALAIATNADSTFVFSLALVSKY